MAFIHMALHAALMLGSRGSVLEINVMDSISVPHSLKDSHGDRDTADLSDDFPEMSNFDSQFESGRAMYLFSWFMRYGE